MTELIWGLQTTALGMGLVFAMLALLWGLLVLVRRLDVPPAAPGTPAQDLPAAPQAAVSAPEGLDPARVAAIATAVMCHRQMLRTKAAPSVRTHWPGTLLHASRWVAAGRTRQNQVWRRNR